MCYLDHFKQTDDEALLSAKLNLDVLQHALEERIQLSTGLAKNAFKQAQIWPNPNTLAAVDRAIKLLQSIRVDAQCLKGLGCPAAHARLSAIIDDFTAARGRLANTKTHRSNAVSLATGQTKLVAGQRDFIDKRLYQACSQAKPP